VILDEHMFKALLAGVRVRGKSVIDVGCGTGRHWNKILALEPAELAGYDVSAGMLDRLKQKYPDATVYLATADSLAHTRAQSCDLVVSTLAFSHFRSARAALGEWARVLRAGGEVLLTDLHPAAAAIAETTFSDGEQVITVKTYVRSLVVLRAAIARSGLELTALREMVVDESMRHRYERAGMRRVFDRLKGLPFVYGMHLRKPQSAVGIGKGSARSSTRLK
jgi:ubiquinone/menaquinone biosynthesis C-methylase UbiE